MEKRLLCLAVLSSLLVCAPVQAQFVGLSIDDNKNGILPHISGRIDTFGAAAQATGTLGLRGGNKQDFSTLGTGEAWAALVYRDLDRVQVGVTGASHPSLTAPSSYLRAAYDEFAFSATWYPLTIAHNHADRPADMIAFAGVTLGYDQRTYFGLADPRLSTDRVVTAGANVFGLVIARPDGELPMHINVLDANLGLELAGDAVKNTAFRFGFNLVDATNIQLTAANADHFAVYLDAAASAFVYKPPIFIDHGFDFSVQSGLGGSAELHYSNARNHLGIGARRSPNLGVTAQTSGMEDRYYIRGTHAFFDDQLSLDALAFVGKATAHDSGTGKESTVDIRGVAADLGYSLLSWLDVGFRGDLGYSPYLNLSRSSPEPSTSVLGFDVGVFARLSWSKGQGSATGIPGPR